MATNAGAGYQNVAMEYTPGGGSSVPAGSRVAGTYTQPGTATTKVVQSSTVFDGQGNTLSGISERFIETTATAATTTVTLSGNGQFSSGVYWLVIQDMTTFGYATITAQTATSFTFNSTAGHTYICRAWGS